MDKFMCHKRKIYKLVNLIARDNKQKPCFLSSGKVTVTNLTSVLNSSLLKVVTIDEYKITALSGTCALPNIEAEIDRCFEYFILELSNP